MIRWRRAATAPETAPEAAPGGAAGPATAPANPVRRWILAVLGLQVVLALLMMSGDLMRALPAALSPSTAPRLSDPVAPGDQTRQFRPDRIAPRPAAPGTRPLPPTDAMPSRLLAERAEWNGTPALLLTGQIAPGDADRLRRELDLVAPVTVILNSSGGSVGDALELGRWLRAAGADTALTPSDICLSACPYILAGGVQRSVAPGAWVGVHQHFFDRNLALPAFLAVEDIQRGQGMVMAYLIEMGVDPAMMQAALMTPPDEIYLLLPEELARFGLITDTDAPSGQPAAD